MVGVVLCVGAVRVFGGEAGGPAAVSGGAAADGPAMPVLPDGLGVNIHFTDPKPGEMKMLADGGFRWVRMDFSWGGTERARGEYDFGAYERLLAALQPHGIRAIFILDYSNKQYDGGMSPCSDEGRQAFARWAAAAAGRFRGRGILWEMYNEPNIGFWKPKPDVNQYILLAMEVGRALRAAAPEESYIGPATSGVDFEFLEACFKAGLLEYWSAVSVHPYRQSPPETAAADYARLRRLIERYAPAGKPVPILSGEWGYSSAWANFTEEKQGNYLPRQWLTNLANNVPISIWYDWHDDGKDPKEAEHHFGTVLNGYFAGRERPYDAKPAYLAARTLATVLAGRRFNKRLAVGSADDYVLLFSDARCDGVRLAAWTAAASPHAVVIPAGPGRFAVTGHTGDSLPALVADAAGLPVTLTDSPQYLAPEGPNDLLRVAAAWESAPAAVRMPARRSATVALGLANPLARPITVATGRGAAAEVGPGERILITTTFDLMRTADPAPVRIECDVKGLGRIAQEMAVSATNPLRLSLVPPAGANLEVRVENPSGEPLRAAMRLTDLDGLKPAAARKPFQIKAGDREMTVRFPLEGPAAAACRFGACVEDAAGEALAVASAVSFAAVDDFSRYTAVTLPQAYRVVGDGDGQVASTQTASPASPPDGPPAPAVATLKIAYSCEAGWKFVRLVPQGDEMKKIEGRPRALGLWLYSDGTGNSPRVRFTDATGQTFQPAADPMKWKGWRWVEFRLDDPHAGHWGGAGDGRIHYPIRWDTLLLIDNVGRQKVQGEVYLAAPTLIR